MKESERHPMPHGHRQDRLSHEWVYNPYKSKHKLRGPTVCPQCGAVFHQGRWTWLTRPEMAYEAPWPACQRVRDKYPAGFLSLHGWHHSGTASKPTVRHDAEGYQTAPHRDITGLDTAFGRHHAFLLSSMASPARATHGAAARRR